jgi:hypothetical protein
LFAARSGRFACSGCVVASEVERHTAIVADEHCDEIEAWAERAEVLVKPRHRNVIDVLELRHCALVNVEPPCELGPADRFGVTQLGQARICSNVVCGEV